MSHQGTFLPHEPVAAPPAAGPATASRPRPRGLLGAIQTVIERWVDAERRQREAKTMLTLPDHLLRDIGVSRGDLRLEARRALRRSRR